VAPNTTVSGATLSAYFVVKCRPTSPAIGSFFL
jgi:hypothetical protein